MAEEASERAIHQLTLAILEGCPPQRPKAWLRTVARRSACALLRSDWARQRAIELDEVPSPQRYRARSNHTSWVRETLQGCLTPRQRDALGAALSCNTTRDAARNCGMQPRDFRRSLGSIGRRGRALLAEQPPALPCDSTPGCEPGMPA